MQPRATALRAIKMGQKGKSQGRSHAWWFTSNGAASSPTLLLSSCYHYHYPAPFQSDPTRSLLSSVGLCSGEWKLPSSPHLCPLLQPSTLEFRGAAPSISPTSHIKLGSGCVLCLVGRGGGGVQSQITQGNVSWSSQMHRCCIPTARSFNDWLIEEE